MLGRFLEVSVHAPDVRESLEFYESLGFVASHEGMKLHFPAPANANRR